jgi:hypothetical protein
LFFARILRTELCEVYDCHRQGGILMNHKGKIVQLTSVFLFITVISIFFCCAPKDPAAIASKVAEDWASNNVNDVSKSIAGLVVNNNPLLQTVVGTAITNEINQRIKWEFSYPQKIEEDQYTVIATAYAIIGLPLFGSYILSVNYNLAVDAKNKKVISSNIDAGSFAMQKQ